MHGVYKDGTQSACALQVVMDSNGSGPPVDHKHKHSAVQAEILGGLVDFCGRHY